MHRAKKRYPIVYTSPTGTTSTYSALGNAFTTIFDNNATEELDMTSVVETRDEERGEVLCKKRQNIMSCFTNPTREAYTSAKSKTSTVVFTNAYFSRNPAEDPDPEESKASPSSAGGPSRRRVL